eukprot:TRINITY_DN51151_c0_g1_i1.p1 TRINITY_DN51151_c0_g1~~TRINITY_DN51151_c0_g1_i1.p1  ORF type:complete len:493 (+),score=114.83 TRINITY_DN51151_c0_g1_i1:117-1595(+)
MTMKHALLACLALAVTADATSYKLVKVHFDPPSDYPAGDVVLHLMLFPFTEVCLLCERNTGSCNVTTDVSGLQPASMLVSTDPSVRGIETHVNVVGWLRTPTYTCSRQPPSPRSLSGFGGVAGVFGEGTVSISRGWYTPLSVNNYEKAFDGVKLTFERDTASATALEHVDEYYSGHSTLSHELDVLISNITVAATGRRSGAITFAYGSSRLTKCFACNGTTSHQGCYLIGTDFSSGSEYFKTSVSGLKVWHSEWTRPDLSTGVPTQTLCKPRTGGYPTPTSEVHDFGGFEVYNRKRITIGSLTVTLSTQKVWVPGTTLSLPGEGSGVTDPDVVILAVLLPTGCLIMVCVVCCLRRARRNADDAEAPDEEPPSRPSQEQWASADTTNTAAAAPEPEVIIPPRQLSALPIGFGDVRFEEPQHMVCPISLQLMQDPVFCGCQHKHVYERACLEAHVMKNGRCPMSREEMTMQDIKPHAALKVEIEEYVATQRSLE